MNMRSSESGFSLLELIIVLTLSSIIAIVTSRIIYSQMDSVNTSMNGINASTQARVALERMARDLRNVASSASLLSTSTANKIDFVDSSGNSISYSLSGSTLLRNSDVLADNIQSLTFNYYDKSGTIINPPPTTSTVYIKMTVVVSFKSSSITMTTGVFMRNA